jgi:hypothetical protein
VRLLTIESGAAKRLFWSIAAGVVVLVFVTSAQDDPLLVAGAALLVIAGLFPFHLWVLGQGHGLPIWPAFAGYTCLSAALPVIQSSVTLGPYSSDAILTGLATIGGFVFLGTLVWLSMSSRLPRPPRTVLMLESGSAVRSLLICVGAGLLFNANTVAGWFNMPGNTMQIARGIAGGLSYLGVFALAYFHGAKLVSRPVVILYTTMTVLLVLFSMTGIMLANAVPIATLWLIGYTLGAGRVSWKMLAVLFVVASLFHTGKPMMRNIYLVENPEKWNTVSIYTLPFFYLEWAGYGVESIGGFRGMFGLGAKEEETSTVFERAGNLHMLLLVQDKSPDEVPFLNGLTYEPIPLLLVPRFLAPDKGLSHAGNILLSLNYGLQDIEATRSTSIGWNLVAEGYANFGFLGVFAMALFLAVLYSAVARITVGVPITSFRFVSGLVVMAGVTNDNSLGVFLTMQFQSIVGVALASVFLMRRQPNPFAPGEEHTIPQMEGRVDREGNRRPEGSAMGDGTKANGLHGSQTTNGTGRQFSADGGTVRTMPIRMPKRLASWMPRRVRAAVVAQYDTAQEVSGEEGELVGGLKDEETQRLKEKSSRPRQLAVPFQNYRRYRG